MIKYLGVEMNPQSLLSQYPSGSAEIEMIENLSKSTKVYDYSSQDELVFEINLRRNIINASLALYRGRLGFRTFHESKCNEDFWERLVNGGFVLKKDIKPSDAINDIFRNTRKYGTECATAIVMIYYKAVLEAYSENLFNKAFTEITLMNWQQLDDILGVATYRRLSDYLPGDCRYFKNPDVNPLTPEWQGENAIDLSSGSYYGHGIGIGSQEKFIAVLNANRVEDAQASAYLMDNATRPDFNGLYQYKKNSIPEHIIFPVVVTGAVPAATSGAVPSAATGAAPAVTTGTVPAATPVAVTGAVPVTVTGTVPSV